MTVSLSPELEALVHQKMQTGQYNTPNEVMQEAMRLLDARDRLARIREIVAIGIAQADRGEVVEMTDEVWDEIEREADEEERLGLPLDPDVCP